MIGIVPGKKITHIFICLLALILFSTFSRAEEQKGQQEQKESSPQEEKLSASVASTLIKMYQFNNQLPRELIDLKNSLEAISRSEQLLEKLPEVETEIEKLDWEIMMLGSDANPSYHQLASLDTRLEKLKTLLNIHYSPVQKNIDRLEKLFAEWTAREDNLQKLQTAPASRLYPQEALDNFARLEELVAGAKEDIIAQLQPTLDAGRKMEEVKTRVYGLNDKVRALTREISELELQQSSPSVFSREYYKKFNKLLFANTWQRLRLFYTYQVQYIKENVSLLCYYLLLIFAAALFTHVSRRLVPASSRWYVFSERPLYSSIFVVTAVVSLINVLPFRLDLPPGWDALVNLPLFFAVAMLTDTVCNVPWQSRLLRELTLSFTVLQFFMFIELPQDLLFVFIFYAAIIVLVYYLFLFKKRYRKNRKKAVTWAIWIWAVIPLMIIISGVSGHDQLAVTLLNSILSGIVITLMVWSMLVMFAGFSEFILLNVPVRIIRQNAVILVKELFPVMFVVYLVLWLSILLMVLRIFPSVNDAFTALFTTELVLFSLKFTPVSVLMVIIVVYLTFLVSKGIRAFLLQEVLPRYGTGEGVQLSITRLVHYAILTAGFLLLLKLLGFELKQLTILGGALGVGIGFGLQAIVNNFVSGLILLFERPLKVMDIIEAGERMGRVKSLGLRATVVQTFDNAEIVIPNSELITGTVTNWTLAEKAARVRVPVGVAYGTDISRVIEILVQCAKEHPLVLSTPPPRAMFLAFGASSLDFELRAWIPDVRQRTATLSELNQEIESEFSQAGIEIPFPQSDLHLRTVSEEAATGLRSAGNRQVDELKS